MASTWWSGTRCSLQKGTPPEIVEKLNSALVKAIARIQHRARNFFSWAQSRPGETGSPQALRQIHAADIVAKWGEVIRGANIKVE